MDIFLMVLGGLGLFLFAINNLSDTLKDLIGNKANKWLNLFTKNLIASILTGTVATILLDSSSAVIIMTIVLVNTGALSFRQSLGIVMGANIGTTFSSQLIALDVGQYSPIPIFLGLVFSFLAKSEKITKTARVVLFFGILFFGLYTMERAVEPLKDHPEFLSWMEKLDNPLRGTLIGALVTLVIQSSSATVGMVITLAKKELIHLPGAIAVMLGAELGTCSDTLLATIRSDRQAVKTGLFHLSFNIICIAVGLAVFPLFNKLIEWVSGSAVIEQKIANAHMIFNIAGVILFLPFIPMVERLLDRLLPNKEKVPENEPSLTTG
ncbi:Na/Pi cotransporter family protein [Dyadobacter arcticus]|uniref:Phosphate:Na+ symporter n=1 Tax=Dyadobacter arcticus TaxID=1078754 RepID=A0ABX0UNG8_9BACT|nr:Na/Pi symporter [Dyadobacter arcticus]NIJ54529.1 phosphate:Na+ symporter [Dyadobacter arcticus]